MIVLKQGPLNIEITTDNPVYSTLKRFVGESFTVVIDSNKATIQSKHRAINREPSAEELITSLQNRAGRGDIVPQITTTVVEDMAPFEIVVDPTKIFEDLDKLYLEDSLVKALLRSHIETVLGTTASSSIKASHYKATGKLSKGPYYTIYRHIPDRGLFYLTVRSDLHDAARE